MLTCLAFKELKDICRTSRSFLDRKWRSSIASRGVDKNMEHRAEGAFLQPAGLALVPRSMGLELVSPLVELVDSRPPRTQAELWPGE